MEAFRSISSPSMPHTQWHQRSQASSFLSKMPSSQKESVKERISKQRVKLLRRHQLITHLEQLSGIHKIHVPRTKENSFGVSRDYNCSRLALSRPRLPRKSPEEDSLPNKRLLLSRPVCYSRNILLRNRSPAPQVRRKPPGECPSAVLRSLEEFSCRLSRLTVIKIPADLRVFSSNYSDLK